MAAVSVAKRTAAAQRLCNLHWRRQHEGKPLDVPNQMADMTDAVTVAWMMEERHAAAARRRMLSSTLPGAFKVACVGDTLRFDHRGDMSELIGALSRPARIRFRPGPGQSAGCPLRGLLDGFAVNGTVLIHVLRHAVWTGSYCESAPSPSSTWY
jgi:hypothetical protein